MLALCTATSLTMLPSMPRHILRPLGCGGARAVRLCQSLAADVPPPSSAGARRRVLLDEATAEDWERAIEALQPFARANRMTRLSDVISKRRARLHLVLENIADPYNIAAVLRTAEGLGVQNVHIIESVHSPMHEPMHVPMPERSQPNRGPLGKVAMGASRWLTVSRYRSAADCCAHLREQELQIFASDCPPVLEADDEARDKPDRWRDQRDAAFDALPIDQLDFAGAGGGGTGRGTALVFGNERRGVSRAFIERADRAFYLPMCGLTQSFNISVAVAMSLYHATASGAFPEGSLPHEARVQLLGRWLLRDVKAARQLLLQRANLEFTDF